MILAKSDPCPPPRFQSRWMTGSNSHVLDRLVVDDTDEMQRQYWKRNDDGFRLVLTEPLEENS